MRLGTGLGYLPSLGIGAHYFFQKRPLVMGIIAAGAPMGAVIHPIMLNKLIHGSLGFHNAIIANLLVRTRLPPKPNPGFVPVREFAKDLPYLSALAGWTTQYMESTPTLHSIRSVSILQAANFFGRIIPQLMLPYIGLFNLQLVCTTSSTALVFSMIAVTTVGGTIPFTIFYGFFSGATTFARNFGEVSVRMGLGIFLGGLGGLIGVPIDRALLTSHFVWWRPAVFSGVLLAAASLFFLGSRMGVASRKGTQKV
ncbi:hypothetical protein D9757_013751 [Collybiopsis confluens]|uniref:Uncharacterized protein n=1 Tax=Collybiopsis confluens TaxID=2823264 RepID=A0A8H5CW15_9AGAR|nr:hypothetical protein D9757_013751 [Collybiopsis confluens]